MSTHQYESTDELHQGMLSALTDDIINLIMSMDVVHFKTMLDKSRATNQENEEELRKRQTTIGDLECRVSKKNSRRIFGRKLFFLVFSQLSVMEVELRSALEGQNRAQADASETSLAQDDVVTQARCDRDTAIQRRTKAEIELAKTRVELMQANSELLEAINQKVELSQQLEQWQVRFPLRLTIGAGGCSSRIRNFEHNARNFGQNGLNCRTKSNYRTHVTFTHPFATHFSQKPSLGRHARAARRTNEAPTRGHGAQE